MAGYFEINFIDRGAGDEKGTPTASAPTGSVAKTLEIKSIDQYKGNLRVDFAVTNITNGTVTPPYGYAFLDEDEIITCNVSVAGDPGTGNLEAVAFDGEDTDTATKSVTIPNP